MKFNRFMKESGFKILAMAHLQQCEYSIVLYLINCLVSGMEEIVTTHSELASLLAYDQDDIDKALINLSNLKMIKQKDLPKSHNTSASVALSFEHNPSKWSLSRDDDLDHHDAIIYPFVRNKDKTKLTIAEDEQDEEIEAQEEDSNESPWQNLVNHFARERSLSEKEFEEAKKYAQVLLETHPQEQVMLLLDYFGKRILHLSLLAGSWQHYIELYESEHQQIDLMQARRTHQQLDDKLRLSAQSWLSQSEEKKFSEDEKNVLELIIKHPHPRRQLYWAHRASGNYKKLKDFFKENHELMLSITSTGNVVKKPPRKD